MAMQEEFVCMRLAQLFIPKIRELLLHFKELSQLLTSCNVLRVNNCPDFPGEHSNFTSSALHSWHQSFDGCKISIPMDFNFIYDNLMEHIEISDSRIQVICENQCTVCKESKAPKTSDCQINFLMIQAKFSTSPLRRTSLASLLPPYNATNVHTPIPTKVDRHEDSA